MTFISGNAALLGGKDAKLQILEIVAKEYNLKIEDLDIKAEKVIIKSDGKVLMTFDKALELCYSFNLPSKYLYS